MVTLYERPDGNLAVTLFLASEPRDGEKVKREKDKARER